MKILLFDIDGTLIRSGGAGKTAMESALRSAFGVPEVRNRINFSGRTDPGIIREFLVDHDIDPSTANQSRMMQHYLEYLPRALQQYRGIVLPGVVPLLTHLHKQEAILCGLLTGNVRAGAEVKLTHFELWDYFACGAFADGCLDRDDVARHGFREMERHLGRTVDPKDIWVIGDTPLDVQCARAIGANAIAVTTGWHTREELQASGADHVLDSLEGFDTTMLGGEWRVANGE